jgi:hypothetical protein
VEEALQWALHHGDIQGQNLLDFEVAKPESFYYPLVICYIAIENDH